MKRYSILLALLLSPILHAQSTLTQSALPDFSALAERVAPAVVNISTVRSPKEQSERRMPHEIPWQDFFDKFVDPHPRQPPHQDENSAGSGFIIRANGEIVTSYHVVKEVDQIIVKLNNRRELPAEIIGFDELSDVALLKIEAEDLPTVQIGSSEALRVGQWVLAIGAPFGFDYTVTAGIVSAKGRSLPFGNYVPFLQTDVAINPGNSGGPLFDLNGKVVGINSQIYSQTGTYAGLSFAVPIDLALYVIEQLKENGTVARGWLGIYLQKITRDLSKSFNLDRPIGALVTEVVEDSPAATAGIQVGDVILKYNGVEVESSSFLPPLVGRTPIGTRATIELMRENKIKEVKVTIAQLPSDMSSVVATQPQKKTEKIMGMTLKELSPEQRSRPVFDKGGLIVEAVADGAAKQARVLPGDILLMFNNRRFETVEEFAKIVDDAPAGRFVTLLVVRDEQSLFLALKLPE